MKRGTSSVAPAHATLYRTYRPSAFEDVRGQEHVVSVLQAAIASKKLAHAYLFVGGRGTGKTTVARIFARELGVSDKDLYEMDAASHTSVEDVRELREGVNAMPFESPYKFYIIDEAHMLSKQAWNAFLKTLEEPPPHVLFVLATTERDKVPDTIQSRCDVYSFRPPTREMLAEAVTTVAKKEGYALERSAAELVALLAEGSYRDALSILQKVLTVSKDKKIDVTEVEAVTGAPRGELVRQLLRAMAEANASDALRAVQEAVAANLDARTLTKLLIHRLRVVILLRFAPELASAFSKELAEPDMELATALSKSAEVTSDALRVLLDAYERMAYAAVPHVPLELAIVDICGAAAQE
ncbi:DNA polymerase III, subunit gamma and tau [Candidatus Kaiserbacteria bacterium CG10_big_fil_rev_8_21_14_0_10_59_10]|uniref:DNA polymerase III subunit gamma/tau n=1 Tax=Candidatus Kaiserbacteria bacterium CG10_big_fil_rev_8_21_14_0_10_59_10 TaxID=1974612 RepID=A0A2H0U6X1_9BACT|nr:MAG: DNA polymerase III, subunit gamma and tau [Candidatus Kaiserbacteria bacterium CG10_big_fil_rev_8_21_14_0_10_59_10]